MVLPSEEMKILKLKNDRYKVAIPCTIYADLECILQPSDGGDDDSLHQKHIPDSVAFYLQCSFDNNLSRFEIKRGSDCIAWVMDELKKIGVMTLNIQIIATSQNLSGYDAHFRILDLVKEFNGSVELLPLTKEKNSSFKRSIPQTKVNLRFIDSFRFMASSLKKLASYFTDEDKTITQAHCSTEQFHLLMRKGEVWKKFNITTLGEYSDLYSKTDVLLLADIFENFRKSCLSVYKLGPLHTAPELAFDAMLKCTRVEIELFTEADKLLFIEKGIRGGVAQCINRYAHANNRYMGENYNPNEEESYLMYIDLNNLYGAAMSQYLPLGAFEWENFDGFNVLNGPDDSPIRYILEVVLEYPKELHDLMNNAVFGKTMENVRKHRDVKLITKWDGRYGARACIARSNFQSSLIFNDNMAIIELKRVQIWFNKPIYIAFAISD
ncbi:uncharacterized protein [Fopius arisanus]|uniref:DNA-directed DNA polymerase n=1 Tax=Fopius arisanus TaxID=64838 RepID=A0A9R1TIB1_9HYME|nr:PREDICTED: uncharacterized protein LOC105270314 [Fopius arisanus]